MAQIAQKTGLSLWAAQKIVDACAALGLLQRREGLYYNASDVEKYLVRGKPGYRGIWMTLGKASFAMWTEVAAILRGDRPPWGEGFYHEAWKNEEVAHLMNQATFNIGLGSGYRLARSFDFSPYSLLLDLAGGSGCYCIALTSEYPHLRAIVMDYATICASAEKFISQAGLSERIKTHPGDLVKDDFPQEADVMLMSSCLPNFTSGELRTVFTKAFQAMVPGGTMIILGEALNNDRTGPVEPAYWGLEEALVGGHGESHTVAEVCQLLEEAGFINCEVGEFVPGVLTRITSQKQK